MPAHLSASDVLAVAKREVGTTESPAGSNRQKYGAAFGWNGVSWCGIYVWWCFLAAGIDLREHGFPGTTCASTNAFDAGAVRAGWAHVSAGAEEPGDVVLYDFGVTGPGDSPNDDDHMGLVQANLPGSYLRAYEGNTSSGMAGSQSNGGGVFLRTRAYSLVRHIYRPPWARLIPEDDVALDDADITKIAKAVAAEQLQLSAPSMKALIEQFLAYKVPLTKAAAEAMTSGGTGTTWTEGELVSLSYLIQWGGGGLYRLLGEERAQGQVVAGVRADVAGIQAGTGADPKALAAAVADELAGRLQS